MPVQQVRATLPARVVLFIIRHPVVSSTTFVAMFLAGLLLMAPKTAIKDTNPAYARAKDEFLIACNKEGQELWKKHINRYYDLQRMSDFLQRFPDKALAVIDVDGDGKNEILAIFGDTGGMQLTNVILCFNGDGSERWRCDLHRTPTIGGVTYSDDWQFYLMCVGDFDRDGKLEIVAAAKHIAWFPNVLVRLNARDGSFVSEYWHNGMLHEFEHRDLDGDGVEELIFGGQNNRVQAACLAVFDPHKIEGAGPTPEAYKPKAVSVGSEKYYVIFPASDLQPFWRDITNEIRLINWKQNGRLEVVVNERIFVPETQKDKPMESGGDLHFYLDRSLRCVDVRASDSFTALHTRYKSLGKVHSEIDAAYLEKLRQGVRYWDGEKFVNQLTMNMRYLEAMKQQPIP